MQRLKERGANDPIVQVLKQEWEVPLAAECKLLSMDISSIALVREVLISSDQDQWMYARTIFPKKTLAEEDQLAHLNNRSLGSVLFADPTLQRSEFEIACLMPESLWHDKAIQHANKKSDALWARRSIFKVREKPLLLTEIFLPDMEKLCK